MIYFIVTTSIFNDCPIRQEQYRNCVATLKERVHALNITNYKIIIVENNGVRGTILDTFDCDVYYTRNNFLPTCNKGYKELQDVFDVIDKYNILDTDFIVKITGRYILCNTSEFMNVLKNIEITKYDCIIKYGSYVTPVDYKMDDCITGLIGMSCKYVKQIQLPSKTECVEWKWAYTTRLIDDTKIYKVNSLGINICPESNTYFCV
jgi:hypothetical protein